MLRISLREFQRNAHSYLSQLPVALTRYNRVVCIVNRPTANDKNAIALATDLKKNVSIDKDVSKLQKEKSLNTCKHGFMKGLCKHGCK